MTRECSISRGEARLYSGGIRVGGIRVAHRARKDGAGVRMNVTAHQEKKKNEETKKGKSRA